MKSIKSDKYLNGTHLNSLNRKYAEVSSMEWDKKPNIYIKYTSFHPLDRVSSGRNGVSKVLQLITETFEVESVFWMHSPRWSPVLYVEVSTRACHGFGSQDQKCLFIYKDSKGRKESLEISKPWDSENFDSVDRLIFNMDDKIPLKLKNKPWAIKQDWKLRLKKHIRDSFYSAFRDMRRGSIPEDLKKILKIYGIEVLKTVPFTHRFNMFGIKYMKSSTDGLSLEIGQKNVATYNSLPSILEIKVQKSPIKLIKLGSIGIEETGYYSHDDRMEILSTDLKKCLNFKKRFNRKGK